METPKPTPLKRPVVTWNIVLRTVPNLNLEITRPGCRVFTNSKTGPAYFNPRSMETGTFTFISSRAWLMVLP